MITDISPIFGLPLLGLMEILTILAGVGSIIIAVAILIVHIRQHRLQVKIASAHLSLKMLEFWKSTVDPDFAIFADKMQRKEVDEGNPTIHGFLEALEEVAIFWKEGTITTNHIKEFFKPELETIPRNDPVMRRLKEKREEGAYERLCELLAELKICDCYS